ncbi:MAG TPA: serine/threonine-protein kinase, partial [Polyangia bacterium]
MTEEYPRPFGKYTLLRPLAKGGMGEIFLAAAGEIGGFEKLCVIKKVLAERGDESKAARFVDEAKVVIRLSHGNLVSVFDAGMANDELYLAMELVEGHDLGAVWNRCAERRARFPVDIALYVVREVCRGLAYAHGYGGLALVHRDVTPPNILLSIFGEVKLTDFGLARSALKQEFTQPGVVYGRLAYLSPEQAHGRAVDARSDLYSLGIILWELLTGTQLFRVSGADPVTAISVVRNPKIEPPSRRVPRLPATLDDLVMRALALDPAQRYQSAEEMRRAVAVELAALAPTIDTERVAAFMRMLYGDEIDRERAEREHLLGRDRPPGPRAESGARARPPVTAALGRGRSGREGRAGRPVAKPSAPAATGAKTVPIGRRGAPGQSAPVAMGAPTPPKVILAPDAAAPAHAVLADEDAVPPPPSRVGDVVEGRYRLDAVLGVGAMGTVYEAEHVEIGRGVALKILHPIYSRNAELVQRFRREARAASTIGHPNIVDVTDFGSTADGCAYFVMERLRGQDLKAALAQERQMRPPRAVEIMVQVCQALQAAHEHGVIHRDLKPENIFLVPRDGSPDFVKILDFGIAKSLGFGQGDGRSLTMPGIAMGTPAYMAPEQAAGQKVDGRTDIYAVGAILYELLAGVAPFEGDDILDVLTRKAREDPPSLAGRVADVPPALEQLVMRALRRDPAERPPSMADFAAQLRGVPRPRGAAGDSLLGLMAGGPRPAARAPAAAPQRPANDGSFDAPALRGPPAAARTHAPPAGRRW